MTKRKARKRKTRFEPTRRHMWVTITALAAMTYMRTFVEPDAARAESLVLTSIILGFIAAAAMVFMPIWCDKVQYAEDYFGGRIPKVSSWDYLTALAAKVADVITTIIWWVTIPAFVAFVWGWSDELNRAIEWVLLGK